MKTKLGSQFSWRRVAGVSAALLLGATAPSPAFLGFGKKERRKPTASEQASNEDAANALFAEARAEEASNRFSKARKTYRAIVKNYPRSGVAAESQFKIGEILQVDGKDKKAFEAFQKFLTGYKGSPRYAEAVQRQFNIAENLRTSGKKGFLGGIGASVQPSKLIEFYGQISASAPRTEISAQSRIAVGTIQAKQGNLAESIATFDTVVEDYPKTKYAAEAQFNLVKLHGREASKSHSRIDLRQQQEAGDDFITQFGSDPRTGEVRQALGQVSAKQSAKAYDVARFYEKSGDTKAAVIYYREVVRTPQSKNYGDAQKRMAKLIEKDPSLAQIANARPAPVSGQGSDTAPLIPRPQVPGSVAAASPVVPPPTTPAAVSPPTVEKPKMRTSPDEVLPIPSDDPLKNN